MTDPVVLVIDAGTGGTKVGAVDLTGAVVGHAYRTYGLSHPHPGWVEQDVDTLRVASDEAVAEVIGSVGADRVIGIACSSQRATWVPLDRSGEPLMPYLSWQDNRGHELLSTVGADYTERTGMLPDVISSMTKIKWFLDHRPELASRCGCYAAHQTVLLRQLGVPENLVSPSEASYLGLMDIRTRQWDSELVSSLGLDHDCLPRIVESGTPVGKVPPDVARRTGLPAGLPIMMGGGDLQLGVLGVGGMSVGVVAVGIGTGGGCVLSATHPLVDPEGRLNCLAHVAPGWWEAEGLGMAAGGSFRWFRDTFGAEELRIEDRTGVDAYDQLTQQAPPHPTDLLVIPALAGLGAPRLDPRFAGTVLGLRLDHDRGDLIRAFLEGISLEQRAILSALSRLGEPIDAVRAWGGASKSDLWCQLQADVYAKPVSRSAHADASLIGAAICAVAGLEGAEIPELATRMTSVSRSWDPIPEHSQTYDRLFDLYERAVTSLQAAGITDALFGLRQQP